MIKYFTRSEFMDIDYMNQIKGYDNVKYVLRKQLQIIQQAKQVGSIIPGVVLIGKKHHGKHFMTNVFIKALQKKSISVHSSQAGSHFTELQAFLDNADRDEIVVVLLDIIDQITEAQIESISSIIHNSGQKCYILGISEEDGESVKHCMTCGLIEYAVAATTPLLKDTEGFLEYLIHEKYRHFTFDMEMKDLTAATYSLCYRDLDQLLQSSIRETRSDNLRAVGESQIMNAVLRRYYAVNTTIEYLTDRKIRETAIHEAGHAVVAEILKPGSVGYASVWLNGGRSPMGSTVIIREDIEFKGCMDEVKVCLGGMAAEEICNGYISPGCGGDITDVVNILTTLIGREACYGLEYLDHYALRSDEQQKEYSRKVRTVLLQTYGEVKKMLEPNKSIIIGLGETLAEKGYVLGKAVGSKL